MVNSVDNFKEFQRYDNEFHYIIACCTYNPIIAQIANLMKSAFEANEEVFIHIDKIKNSIEYHKLILDNIKTRNPELASIYSKLHIECTIKQVLKISDLDAKNT